MAGNGQGDDLENLHRLMTAPNLKLVNELPDSAIAAVEREIKAARKPASMSRFGGPAAGEILPPAPPEIRYDDLGNAERFLDICGEDLIYSAEAKKWLVWTGTHWETDNTNLVFDLAIDFAKQLYSPENCRDDQAFKHARRSNMRAGLNAMLEIAQRKKMVTIDKFDTGTELINLQNGTYDLRTREFRSHDRTDYITRVVHSKL
jgi:hypothetical protein